MAAIHTEERRRRVELLTLLSIRRHELNPEQFTVPCSQIFAQFDESWQGRYSSLVGRIQHLSPKAVLAQDEDAVNSLRESFDGVSADLTFREAWMQQCFQGIVKEDTNQALLMVWYRLAHRLPLLPEHLQTLPDHYSNMCQCLSPYILLLGNVKLSSFLPNHPRRQRSLSDEQLRSAFQYFTRILRGWVFWFEKLDLSQCLPSNQHYSSEQMAGALWRILSQFIPTFSQEHGIQFLLKSRALQVLIRKNFPGLISPGEISFANRLASYAGEHKIVFEPIRLFPQIGRAAGMISDRPVAWQTEMFNCISPMIPLLEAMCTSTEQLKSDLCCRWWPGVLDEARLNEMQATVMAQHQIFWMTSSMLLLFSRTLYQELRQHLNCVVEVPREGRLLPLRLDAVIRAEAVCVHGLQACVQRELADRFAIQCQPDEAKHSSHESAKPLLRKPSAKKRRAAAARTQRATSASIVCVSLTEDNVGELVARLRSEEIESMLPLMTALVTHMNEHYPREIGDHLCVLTQGLALFARCLRDGRQELLAGILHAMLIDAHIALEQKFMHMLASLGQDRELSFDLAILAQQANYRYTAREQEWLKEVSLMLYWAHYPASSERKFGPQPKPQMFQFLCDLAHHRNLEGASITIWSELVDFYIEVLNIVNPPETEVPDITGSIENHLLEHKELMTIAAPLHVIRPSPFQEMRNAIQRELDQWEEAPDFARVLEEVIWSLRLLEQDQVLRECYPDPQWRFFHERNALRVGGLFLNLYRADLLLHEREDCTTLSVQEAMDALDGIREFSLEERMFLYSINMRTSLDYHTQPSPMGHAYEQLLVGSQLAVDAQDARAAHYWPYFDKAMEMFQEHLQFTLQALVVRRERR